MSVSFGRLFLCYSRMMELQLQEYIDVQVHCSKSSLYCVTLRWELDKVKAKVADAYASTTFCA